MHLALPGGGCQVGDRCRPIGQKVSPLIGDYFQLFLAYSSRLMHSAASSPVTPKFMCRSSAKATGCPSDRQANNPCSRSARRIIPISVRRLMQKYGVSVVPGRLCASPGRIQLLLAFAHRLPATRAGHQRTRYTSDNSVEFSRSRRQWAGSCGRVSRRCAEFTAGEGDEPHSSASTGTRCSLWNLALTLNYYDIDYKGSARKPAVFGRSYKHSCFSARCYFLSVEWAANGARPGSPG